MPDPLHLVGVQVVVYRNGKYLVIVRGPNESEAPGAISFPSGKVEHDETPTDVLEHAARREVLEETGVSVGDLTYVRSRSFTMTRGVPCVFVEFLSLESAGEARVADPGEVAGVDWLSIEEIEAHPESRSWTIETARAADTLRLSLG